MERGIAAPQLGVNRHWLERAVESRWFALADFGLAASAVALWAMQSLSPWEFPMGGWPLILPLIPWTIRVLTSRFPVRTTGLELPLALILLMGGAGVWAAYDRVGAWAKFWTIVGGVLIYFALAAQPKRNLWLLGGLLGLVSVGMASFFLLTHDWTILPAKVAPLNDIGMWWMSFRPSVPMEGIHPNGAGAVIDIFFPFLVAIGLHAWHERRPLLLVLAAAAAWIALIGLAMTTSRAAWLGFAVGMGTWLLWSVSGRVARTIRWRPIAVFAPVLMSAGVFLTLLALTHPGGVVGLADSLPGPPSGESRIELTRHSLELVQDFPFTGGGLSSFPGLYSQYILVTPFYILDYGHNLFLDFALDFGLLGLLALTALITAVAWKLIKGLNSRNGAPFEMGLLRWATIAAFSALLVQGLVGYSHQGAPLLFLIIGMAISLTGPVDLLSREAEQIPSRSAIKLGKSRRWPTVIAVSVILIAASPLILGFRNAVLAQWYANLGAVMMARVELGRFPAGEWDTGANLSALTLAQTSFERALELDPANKTAHHRLGLIAMLGRDFNVAVTHLEQAYEADSSHRGIRKALGYSYVWAGELDRAVPVLATIPEALQEMRVYVWWWGVQGRQDLAAEAESMAERLESAVGESGG